MCIKQVPAKDAPLAIAGNWIKESDIGFEMNEPDSYALEEALRLKEKHGGEVVALSMGPERVKQTIKEALAKGADRLPACRVTTMGSARPACCLPPCSTARTPPSSCKLKCRTER